MKDYQVTVKDEATSWWAEMIKQGEHVVSADRIPEQRKRKFLVKQGLLCQAAKGYWVLKRPEDTLEEVWPLLYWQVVERILARLKDWSIRGRSALMILNGDQTAQEDLLVRTKAKTNRKISLPLGFRLSLVHDPGFDERLVRKMLVGDSTVSVDVPEKVLADSGKLPPSAEARNFLAGTDFDMRVVEALYATRPRPIVFKRLIDLAVEVGRPDLARGLRRIIETHTHYQVVRRVGAGESVPTTKAKHVSPPWVLRQEEQFRQFAEILEKRLSRRITGLVQRPLRGLLDQAREHKRYDTYHSTTLEGYKITPEEVDALLSGVVPKKRTGDKDKYVDEVQNRMAILGYSEAFDFALRQAESDFGHPEITEQLVKDTYYHLFKPSADAGVIDYLSLTTYRNIPAFIRGTPYAPPSNEKLPELMASLASSLAAVKNPVVKAVLAHYWFVTIHPYHDGNGRTARLLMDYLLVSCGYPWVTIRVEERMRYFDSLKAGQVEGDILPLGEFILEAIKGTAQP